MGQRERPRQTDPLESARESLKKLRAADDWDEPTPVVHVHVPPLPTRPTPLPPPRSIAPRNSIELAGSALKRFPPWGGVLVAIVAILVYAYLALHGKTPPPAP